MALVYTFLIFVIIASVIAVEAPTALTSIISLGAVGFGLSIAYLWLGAPDIALTQVVVEVIALVLLIRATIGRGVSEVKGTEGKVTLAATLLLFALGSAFFTYYLQDFPQFGQSVMGAFADTPSYYYIAKGLQETGSANLVNAILLDFRAYDTLGEATVLFTSIIGAVLLLRKRAAKKEGGE